MKNKLYTICLGISLNMFELKYITLGRYLEPLSKIKWQKN